MTGDESAEVLGIVRRIGPVVLSSAINPSGTIGTALRRAIGMMVVDTNMIELSVFAFALSVCLDLARHSSATLSTMDRVRKAALAETPKSLPATQTVTTIVRLTLATEARIVAYMTFASREQVENIATAMNDAFNDAAETAADDLDPATYMAVIRLHGDVTRHLAERGRKLPRIIAYSYPVPIPVLRMAQYAYADPKRYGELITENSVVHPAFMPREGKMLAV
jgi:prophage DNA circulation protein